MSGSLGHERHLMRVIYDSRREQEKPGTGRPGLGCKPWEPQAMWVRGTQVCSYPSNQLSYLLTSPSSGFLTDCSPALRSELFTENKSRFESLTQTASDGKMPKCSYSSRGQREGREERKERDPFQSSLCQLSPPAGERTLKAIWVGQQRDKGLSGTWE